MIRRYDTNEVSSVVAVLNNDGVISVPTDTVYGVCARISSIDAYNKLIEVKNRPASKLFPIMCANIDQIKDIAIIGSREEMLIKIFMPGPITLILKKKDDLPDYINNGCQTVAIRMATSDVLEKIIKKVGPVFMSSANQSGEAVCHNLDEIEHCCPKLDGMLEGNVLFGISSTIVDCTSDDINILREGPITLEQINVAIKDVRL